MFFSPKMTIRARRGAALIEFAIIVPLLLLLVFGICEFGLLMKNYLTISQAAREGSRSASLGNPVATIIQRVVATATTVTIDPNRISLEYRDTAGVWVPLGDSGSGNNAPVGSLIRVKVEYDHQLVTGYIFPGQSIKMLTTEMVMRKESGGGSP